MYLKLFNQWGHISRFQFYDRLVNLRKFRKFQIFSMRLAWFRILWGLSKWFMRFSKKNKKNLKFSEIFLVEWTLKLLNWVKEYFPIWFALKIVESWKITKVHDKHKSITRKDSSERKSASCGWYNVFIR